MAFTSFFAYACSTIYSYTVSGAVYLKHGLAGMFNVNYEVVSSVLNCLWSTCNCLYVVLVFTLRFIVTVIQCLEDFLQEVFVLTRALLFLLWKLIVLSFSLASLLLHALEAVVYFLWTGGKWTAETIKISAYSLAENGMGTWDYIVVSVKEFSNSLCGGFTIIGNLGKDVVIFVWEGLFWIYEKFNFMVDEIDVFVRRICSEVIERLYHFLIADLLNIPKETYIGIVICICIFIFMKGICNILGSRGMISPFSYLFSSSTTDRNFAFPVDETTMEFSDDEFEVESNESFGEGEEFTEEEEGSETETDSDMDENEDSDDDEDDDDDTARSESEMSEINIELPAPVNGYYNLRRSETPSRENVSNMKDLEQEVERERERRKCVVCQDRNKSVLILPCKHMCLCVECGNQIARHRVVNRRVCPLCRQKIKTIMNVYV